MMAFRPAQHGFHCDLELKSGQAEIATYTDNDIHM